MARTSFVATRTLTSLDYERDSEVYSANSPSRVSRVHEQAEPVDEVELLLGTGKRVRSDRIGVRLSGPECGHLLIGLPAEQILQTTRPDRPHKAQAS